MPLRRILLILLIAVVVIGAMVATALYVPLPLNPYLDFQVLYRANQGILQGIPLYDRAGQAQMVAENLGVTVDQVFVLPFPYPPWYALATLPIAVLPVDIAVRVWFLLNIAMLLVSVWLMTDGWQPWKRLFSFIVAPLFFPILGALIVGQYVFPTLLGMALLVYALQRKNTTSIALGMALITFKPHVGIFLLLAVVIHLLLGRDEFGRRAFWSVAATGAILFAVGFIADHNWPVNYWQSLFEFKDVSKCQLCVSLPITITAIAGGSFDQAIGVSFILFIGLTILCVKPFPALNNEGLVSLFTCMALLVNPYLQNYDFAFAVIPLFVVVHAADRISTWLVVLTVFLLPSLGLFVGRAGSPTLLISTIILTILILTNHYKGHKIIS